MAKRKDEKAAESTGKQSVLNAVKDAKVKKSILEIAFDEDEFQNIWNSTPSSTKLLVIKDWGKFVFKEKGKETDSSIENDQLDQLRAIKKEFEKMGI
jgi:hypothetical protein